MSHILSHLEALNIKYTNISIVLTSHQENFSFQHKTLLQKITSITLQSFGIQFYWIHLQNTPASEAQGTSQKRGQKYCKGQRIRKFSVRLCFLLMPEAILVNSHHDLNKDNIRHAKVVKGKILNSIQRTTRVGEIIFFIAKEPIPNIQPRNHKSIIL